MPIVTLQRAFRELGRLRLGQQVEFEKNGRTMKRPEKLDTWRLTSPDRSLLEAAAAVYKGEVVSWPEAPDGDEWQLITETDELDIIVPPGRTISQWNEMWSGGGCQRRCDGEREWLKNTPCLCPADPTERNALASKGEACKPTTRLQVILPQLPDLGTWLYVSHGYYAAVELAGTAELLAAAAMQGGQMVKASLWIDQRTVKRPGQGARHFPVAAIRIHETMTALLAGGNGGPALGGRVPAQLGTSAPLPADPSFDQPPAGETASVAQARAGQPDASSTTPPAASTRPADAPPCRHLQKDHQNTEQGIVCGACGTVLAQRDQPAASVAGDGAAPVARGGGESSGSSSAANHSAQSEATSPPGGSSPAPAPTTVADAQSRVGGLALQRGIATNRADPWPETDAALRGRGVEPSDLPGDNETSPEAIAEWVALYDRMAAGEFDAAPVTGGGDDPMGKCQAHDLPWKHVEAGENTVTGKKWNAFWCCPTRDCKARPTKAWRDGQKVGA